MKLDGLVVLVTGGASGIGEQVVRRLLAEKAIVIICDLQVEKGQALEKEFQGKAKYYKCDVTSEKEIEDLINSIEKEFGRLDAVVNSAGVLCAELIATDKKVHDSKSFQRTININTFGTFNVSRYAARLMAKNSKTDKDCNGSIVFVSSVAGIEGQRGQTAYSASKGAILGMTLPMARDLGKFKIRVNAIAPGLIETEMTKDFKNTKMGKEIISSTPIGRLGKPEEIADSIIFCITNDFVNGTTIRVDGGIRFPHF